MRPAISIHPPEILRYAGVVASVAAAALLRLLIHPLLGNKAAFITLFPAIVYSAWVAGFGGGLTATILCTFVAAWFILPPAASLLVADTSNQFSLLVFVLVGVAVSLLGQTQHRAQRQAEESVRRAAESALSAERDAAGLRESEARKAAILEAALDCIITMDDQGRVAEWNPAAERTFGYPRSTALGQTLAELIIPPSLRKAHDEGIAHFLATGAGPILSKRIEVPALHAEGHEFPMELTVVPITLEGRSLFTAYLRDLTERKRAEEEMRLAAVRQRIFLHDVLASVTEGHLILCHTPEELPLSLSAFGAPIALSGSGGLAELRHRTRKAAESLGLSGGRTDDLVTAADETGMNTIVHVGEGIGQVFVSERGDTVQVRIVDSGSGIALENLPHATLKKGYSSAGTLGHGMKMMLQTADRVFLLTSVRGTTVVLEQDRVAPPEIGL